MFIICLEERSRCPTLLYQISMAQSFRSHYQELGQGNFILIGKEFPSFQVIYYLPTRKSHCKKNHAYVTDSQQLTHILIEETIWPIAFVTKWSSRGLPSVWLLLFASICSKLSTIDNYFEIPTFFIINSSLGKSSRFSMPSSSSLIITTFREGFSFSSMKTWFFLKVKLERNHYLRT